MKKTYSSVKKQIVCLGVQLWTVGALAQTAFCAGQAYIPGYYGNTANVLPQPAATALPSGATVIDGIDAINTTANTMTIHQGKPRAVIHWQNFDIGSESTVHFDQQSSSWKALNRVTGDGYSQIMGSLTATGQVYILNQNGILFGQGSQVNVHSLTASALNIDIADDLAFTDSSRSDYLKDLSQGGKEVYRYANGSTEATVANHGAIQAGNLGSVFLIGPQVENNGSITVPGGHVGLLAGDSVEISHAVVSGVGLTSKLDIAVQDGATSGTVTNFADGRIIAEQGSAGMHGSFVNQEGLIRSVTALAHNGTIELKASKGLRTGSGSRTEVLVSDSGERKVIDEAAFQQSQIDISALDGSIEHKGHILAKGGKVTLTAKDRILLSEGSTIDVSGTSVQLKAEDHLVDVQLNSEELRDEFIYKDGPLKGQKVEVDVTTGLPIGDISGYLISKAKSVQELTTKGGSIVLETSGSNGEVIIKANAALDFSGGGLLYGDGLIETTKVRIGRKIYNLLDAPDGVPIDEVLGYHSKKYDRYGLTDEWFGLYSGGSTPLASYLPSFWQGADAGKLTILARKVVADGILNGSALRGVYQDQLEELLDGNGNLATLGRKVPKAGALEVGPGGFNPEAEDMNLRTDAIIVRKDVTPTEISIDDQLSDVNDPLRFSEIAEQTINTAGIGTLNLMANGTIEVEQGVELVLAELGEAGFSAKSITNRGTIRIPSGEATFTTYDIGVNTPGVNKGIYLTDRSVIDVSGRRIDNRYSQLGNVYEFGFTHGGTVSLLDKNKDPNEAVMILAAGSVIDVSGGYTMNNDGSITGNDAGAITIKGDVVPQGNLIGLALEGYEGGTLSIHAEEITLSANGATSVPAGFDLDNPPPETLRHRVVIANDRFADSGFSHLDFKSQGDLHVESGVNLAPSAARLAMPSLSAPSSRLDQNITVSAREEEFGASSLSLSAGETLYNERTDARLIVDDGATLSVASGNGKIELSGPEVTLAGDLIAHGGEVSLSASTRELRLTSSATINVSGTTLPDYAGSVPLQPINSRVIDGGSVFLSAAGTTNGNIVLEEGSLVDVSGSEVVSNHTINSGNLLTTTLASAAGKMRISYGNTFTSDGVIRGHSTLSWLPGGTLSVEKTAKSSMTVREADVASWVQNGFDDLSFSSMRAIAFSESDLDDDTTVSIHVDRGLALNASAITGSDSQDISLSAPWIKLSNVTPGTDRDDLAIRETNVQAESGSARLSIAGDFLDIQGNISLSGFNETAIHLSSDLRLYDYLYNNNWSGKLAAAGNLAIEAAAIYPAMHHALQDNNDPNIHQIYPSSFTISTVLTDAEGNNISKIHILPTTQTTRHPIYSAGGSLTLTAGEIEHEGLLAAPMGELTLEAEKRIWLGHNSILTTAGEAMTLYGSMELGQWNSNGYMKPSGTSPSIFDLPVNDAPAKSVHLTADEIVQLPDAAIDISGGGSIFAYEFLPGFNGTVNPLSLENRYVILPDNSVTLPGKTVYLEGMAGLKEGYYSLLPDEYAFLPGAMVIEATGAGRLPGERVVTAAGYTEVAGFLSDRSISEKSTLRTGFIVRPASEVLAEGKFDVKQIVAGHAGIVEASGTTSILAGPIIGDALYGFDGGSLRLSGEDMFIGSSGSLPTGDLLNNLASNDELPDELIGTLLLDTAKILNKGLRELRLGDEGTKMITIAADTVIDGISSVELSATESITLQEGVEIHAVDATSAQPGTLTLSTETLYGEEGTLLHAADALSLNVDNLSEYTFNGNLQVDAEGALSIKSGIFYLEPVDYTGARSDHGMYLSASLLDSFKSIDNVLLTSGSDMIFLGMVNLAAKNDLTLDSARFSVDNSLTSDPTIGPPGRYPYTVNITAGNTLRLQNIGATSGGDDSFNLNTINLAAQTINFGPGDLRLDNFKSISVAGAGDMIFNGTGSLTADLDSSGSLTFSAARYLSAMTPSLIDDGGSTVLSLEGSNFSVDSRAGNIVMKGNGLSGTSATPMPGSLTVSGANITLDKALFDMPGGNLHFKAEQNISAIQTSIRARGETLNFPVLIDGLAFDNAIDLAGGQVIMQSQTGSINLDSSSIIDTSTANSRAGGTIVLSAATNGVTIDGSVKGDSIGIDTNRIEDFREISRKIADGGFAKLVDLRSRLGDVLIGFTDYMLKTDHFILSADQGAVAIDGSIDVSGQGQGGQVEIYAHDNITLGITGRILAMGEGAQGQGGSITLASAAGAIHTAELSPLYGTGSIMDVSGATPDLGGTVTFRASRDVILNDEMHLGGAIIGATEANVHAFRVYTDSSITSTDVTTFIQDIGIDLPAMQTIWKYSNVEIIPEIEVRSDSSITVSSGLDKLNTLTTGSLGNAPGILSFRASGDLNITSDIIDAPQSSYISQFGSYRPIQDGNRDSWDLNFIAGADLSSSRLLQVRGGVGNFVVGASGNGKLIYSESGNIQFASGNNTTIYASTSGTRNYMPGTDRYNLASFDGLISGQVGNNLLLEGGVIQTAVSDINLQVKNDVKLGSYLVGSVKHDGTIRTIGRAPLVDEMPEEVRDYVNLERFLIPESHWLYRNGGNIVLTANGDITGRIGNPGESGWDYSYKYAAFITDNGKEYYGADYGVKGIFNGHYASAGTTATYGIATLADGDISISAGSLTGQFGAFKDGDVKVSTHGDIEGRFLAADGDLELLALGNIGMNGKTRIGLGSGNLTVQAPGRVALEAITNPHFSTLKNSWLLSYNEHSSIHINSLFSDIAITGNGVFRESILPSSLSLTSGRDIVLSYPDSSKLVMSPSSDGELSLIAGRNIEGKNTTTSSYGNTQLVMSAADPMKVYGEQVYTSIEDAKNLFLFSNTTPDPLHIDSTTPVSVKAGNDISRLSLSVPKLAEIFAGHDIREFGYWGQNLHKNDVSIISAGWDLIQVETEGTNQSFSSMQGGEGINQAGHGLLLVSAGNEINLGKSNGIQSTGSKIGPMKTNNALFTESDRDSYQNYKGADIAVVAGYALEPDPETLEPVSERLTDFFTDLNAYAEEFSKLMATGKEEDESKATRIKEQMLADTINPLLADKKRGSGNIAMTQSSIKTTSGQDNLYIISAGQIDVGTSIISDQKDTSKGILTESGGDINIFAENDINVNESRVVSYFGGDIFMLSNHGDINAGRGSKTAVSQQEGGFIDVGGKLVDKFTAPAPGSGIRAMTTDPDGAGPIAEPKQGNIALIAWEGIIDAGEAGISGDNVLLAATTILNSTNIDSISNVGVPMTGDAGPSLGALAGAGTVSESQQTASQTVGQVTDNNKELAESMSKISETLNMKMLVFKLEGFSDTLESDPAQNNSDSKG